MIGQILAIIAGTFCFLWMCKIIYLGLKQGKDSMKIEETPAPVQEKVKVPIKGATLTVTVDPPPLWSIPAPDPPYYDTSYYWISLKGHHQSLPPTLDLKSAIHIGLNLTEAIKHAVNAGLKNGYVFIVIRSRDHRGVIVRKTYSKWNHDKKKWDDWCDIPLKYIAEDKH